MGFASDWKSAKAAFETATGKKKPSAKFMGVFHKSGLEDVTKALDAALDKGDAKALEKALLDYVKSATSYQSTLEKSAKAEGVSTVAAELKKLGQALDDIGRRAGVAVNERVAELRQTAAAGELKAASAVAEKALSQIDALLAATNGDLKALDKAAAEADDALRKVLESQGAGDAKGAKSAASAVQAAVKTVDAQAKKVAGNAAKAAKLFADARANVTKLKLDPKVHGARNAVHNLFDKIDGIVMKLDELKDQAAADAGEAAEALAQAEQALKGALDVRATYLASCRKLEKRAQDAAAKYDAVARDIGGQADRAQQSQLNAEEAAGDKERADGIKQAVFYISQVRQQAAQAKKEIVAVAGEITKTRKTFPAMVNDKDKEFGPLLANAKDFVDALKESHDALTKAEGKVDRVETALKKLG